MGDDVLPCVFRVPCTCMMLYDETESYVFDMDAQPVKRCDHVGWL